MNRFTPTLIKLGAVVVLAAGPYALTPRAFAAPGTESVTVSAADLQAKADLYRSRMRTDEKRAIEWFTLANRCDQEAKRYRMVALAAGAEPVYRR